MGHVLQVNQKVGPVRSFPPRSAIATWGQTVLSMRFFWPVESFKGVLLRSWALVTMIFVCAEVEVLCCSSNHWTGRRFGKVTSSRSTACESAAEAATIKRTITRRHEVVGFLSGTRV